MKIPNLSLKIDEYLNSSDKKSCEAGLDSKAEKKNANVYFKDGMYSYDCKIINKRFESLEHDELKKEDVNAIVLHQTSSQTALKTLVNYDLGNRIGHFFDLNSRMLPDVFKRMAQGIGAHFLISPNGTIYQTARINRVCYHVGPYLNSRCLMNKTCPESEAHLYSEIKNNLKMDEKSKWKAITDVEIQKKPNDRYPRNIDSIGIEVVGQPEKGVYQKSTLEQMKSSKFLIDLLKGYFNLSCEQIFGHGQISPHKNHTEASILLNSLQKNCFTDMKIIR